MSKTITPLRPRDEGQSALARIDLVAVELLVEGQAPNLQLARIGAILMDLRAHRERLATLLMDLRGRDPSGDAQTDATNAGLVVLIERGIVQVDVFIAQAQILASRAAPSEGT